MKLRETNGKHKLTKDSYIIESLYNIDLEEGAEGEVPETLWSAVCNNDIDSVKDYFEKGGEVNKRYNRFNQQHSLIMGALRNGNMEMVKLLKSFGETVLPDERVEFVDLMFKDEVKNNFDKYLDKYLKEDCEGKDCEEKKELKEGRWSHTLSNGKALRDMIEDEDLEGIRDELLKSYKELFDNELINEDDYNEWTEELEDIDLDEDEIDFQLGEFYDLCDNIRVWIPLGEGLKEDKEPSASKQEGEEEIYKADFIRKPHFYGNLDGFKRELNKYPDSEVECVVKEVITKNIKNLDDLDYIASKSSIKGGSDDKDRLIVTKVISDDGIYLIDREGYDYARYLAFIPKEDIAEGCRGDLKEDINESDLQKYCDLLTKDYMEEIPQENLEKYPQLYDIKYIFKKGKNFYKIIENERGVDSSVHSFVDFDGNVYKPASWKAPAKGVRTTLKDIVDGSVKVDWAGGYLYANRLIRVNESTSKLKEGIWSFPNTKQKARKWNQILSKKWNTDEVDTLRSELYNIFGCDDFFDDIDEYAEEGRNLNWCLNSWINYLREVMKLNGVSDEIISIIKDAKEPIKEDKEEQIVIKEMKEPIDTFKTYEFAKKTNQGWEVVKAFKDKTDNRMHIIAYRPKRNDYAVGLGYNADTGSWNQGWYDYTNVEDAEKSLKKKYDVEEISLEESCKKDLKEGIDIDIDDIKDAFFGVKSTGANPTVSSVSNELSYTYDASLNDIKKVVRANWRKLQDMNYDDEVESSIQNGTTINHRPQVEESCKKDIKESNIDGIEEDKYVYRAPIMTADDTPTDVIESLKESKEARREKCVKALTEAVKKEKASKK